MKEEALRLADAIDEMISDSESYYGRADEVLNPASDMIRKLVAEIDTYRLKNSNQIDTYRYKCKDCGEINPAEIHTCSPQTKPLSDKELIVFLMDDIDKASQWLVEGQTHMAIGVLGQCHAEIRKHLSTTPQTKPLSDEEIKEIYSRTLQTHFVGSLWCDFARAIEERHGIK